jgi:DNA integrity scanning protein DisA with diadenylate cyclase activity
MFKLRNDLFWSSRFRKSVEQIDGSVVLDRDSKLVAFGAILRYRFPANEDEEIGEGGRTALAIGASEFGNVLMVSEGGQLSLPKGSYGVVIVSR